MLRQIRCAAPHDQPQRVILDDRGAPSWQHAAVQLVDEAVLQGQQSGTDCAQLLELQETAVILLRGLRASGAM